MKPNEKNRATNPGEQLDHALNAMRAEQPDHETMNAAGERVWQRVSQEAAFPSTAQVVSIRGCEDVRALLPQYRNGTAPSPVPCWWNLTCMSARLPPRSRNRQARRSALAPWKQELPQVGNTGFRWVALPLQSSFLPSQLTLCRTSSFPARRACAPAWSR